VTIDIEEVVTVVNMVIDHCGQQVVSRGDSVHVAGQM
jgi:hypothetical protein